jgi:hypothetical protein
MPPNIHLDWATCDQDNRDPRPKCVSPGTRPQSLRLLREPSMIHTNFVMRRVFMKHRGTALSVILSLFALALLSWTAPLHAQTFQTIPALDFTMPFGGANPLPQVLTIASTGASFGFTPAASTSSGGNWLSVSPNNLDCCNTPSPVTVSVNGSGLAAGTYQGQILFTDYQNGSVTMTVPVTLTVAASKVAFFDSLPGKLSFSFIPGGKATSQPFQILNAGADTLSWTLTASTADGGKWLTTTASSGTAPSIVSIGITPSALPGGGSTAGTFVGELLLKTSGDSVTIPVAVTVGNSVFVQVNPLNFTASFGGANPLTQILNIDATDNSEIGFTPVAANGKGGNWLAVSPNNLDCCATPHSFAVSITLGTLSVGTYVGEVTVFEYSNPQMSMTIPVTLTVEPSSAAFFADLPGALGFSMKTNGGLSSQVIQVTSAGSGTLNWTVTPTTADTSPWLTVSSTSGTAPSVVTVGVNTSLLPNGGAVAGTYLGQLLFQTAGDATTIPVWVTIGTSVFEQVNAIKFTMPFGGSNPPPQILHIDTTDNSELGFTPVAYTATGGNWLSVSPNNLDCCATPNTVTVSVNASTLAAGTYTGEVTIYEYSNPQLTINVPVTLTVESSGAYFNSLPGALSFSMVTNGAATSQVIEISGAGSGTLSWTATPYTADGGAWLTVSSASGTAPSLVTVEVNASLLPNGGAIAGTYLGELLFGTAGDITSIPVSVTVGTAVFTQVNPITFTMPLGGANPLPQVLNIATTNNSEFGFTPVASPTAGNWLSVSPNNLDCCATPHAITVSVSASTLAAGTYTAEVTIYEYSNPSMSMNVPVTLTIEPSGAFFANSPGGMSFSMPKGAKKVTPQNLQIGDGGSGKLKFTIAPSTSDGGKWLTTSVLTGSAPKTVSVEIAPASLPGGGALAGTFVGQLLLEAGTDTETIPVTVTVGDGVFTQLNPLNFVMPVGGANPLPQILTVASNDASITLGFTPVASAATGGNWLSVSPNNLDCCNTPFPLTVSVNANTLAAGTYAGEIDIYEYANPEMSAVIPVTLTVLPSSKAFFDNTPGQMSFSLEPGGANPAAQTIQLGNGGAGTLSWTVSTNTADTGKWLTLTPTKGSNEGTYKVSVNAKNLPNQGKIAGTFLGQQVLKAATGLVTIPVVVTVDNPVFVEVPTITFNTTKGSNPAPQVVAIDSTGNAMGFTPYARSGKGGNWLSVSPDNLDCCNTPSNLTVSATASSLAVGTYYGDINITEYANPAQSMTIPVVLNVTAAEDEATVTTTNRETH